MNGGNPLRRWHRLRGEVVAAGAVVDEGNDVGLALVALIVSDRTAARRRLREVLEPRRFLVVEAASGDAAWERFPRELPDLVVMDLRTHVTDGVQLVRRIRGTARSWVPILVVTGDTDYDSVKLAVQATKEGATEVLHFRRDLDRLGETAERLCSVSVASLRREKRLRTMQTIRSLLPECEGNLSKLARLAEIPAPHSVYC